KMSEKKAMELQLQVRQNAHEYQNSVKDLYSWEKEIKLKEEALKHAPAPTINTNTAPVRSHIKKAATDNKEQKCATGSPGGSTASTPTEKQDLPVDAMAQQHKKANDIKDQGNTYVKQADYNRAIEAYTEAIIAYPHDPVYFINRALCYLKLERYDNCVEDCEAAIVLDKLCVKAYYRRMQANESLGNNMEALKDCTTVLAIEPKNQEAKRSLQRINERLRKNATKNGPNFNPARDDLIDIHPFDKPAYRRSKQAMRRVPVVDIVSPRPSQDEPKQLRISDDEIDKIFNSNCGHFEEVKKVPVQKSSTDAKTNLDVKVNEIKPTVAASSGIVSSSIKSTEKPLEPRSSVEGNKKTLEKADKSVATKENSKSGNANDNRKSSETIVKAELQATAKLEGSDKIVNVEVKTKETRVPAPPAGTAQFYMTWKELSPSQKYRYLKSIELPKLCKILGASFDSDTFTDLLRTLQDFYVPNKEPTTAAVLHEISKNDEFSILAMMMSSEEKKMITCVMDAIKEFPKSNQALLNKLASAYNLA
ncbi:hypothetical protein KR222_000305, partial [Zaprionus bogoriensis]